MEINKIQHNQPNFQALKSLKYRGLYKKYPEQAKKLKQAFMNNKIAMDFCKTYDVDVSIGAKKHGKNILSNYIRLDFINPIKPKLFGLFVIKDTVMVHATSGNNKSLEHLNNFMLGEITKQKDGKEIGTLAQNIQTTMNEISII